MTVSISLTEKNVLTALRTFLLGVTNNSMEVVRGQDNRVSAPIGANYIVMTPMLHKRLRTNEYTYIDCVFNGSITGTVMSVDVMGYGAIVTDTTVTGDSVADNTTVVNQIDGTPGGAGTYTISISQTVPSGTVLATGREEIEQGTQITVQIDCYGPDSGNTAQVITTLLRDELGVEIFKATGFDVVPLYADEAKQAPFANGEQQIEQRWIIDAVLQANPVVTVPLTYADQLHCDMINIDVTY